MPQLSLNNVTFAYSHPPLLESATLHIEAGERIGLVGRNGAGKSTLLKLINQEISPDNGSVDFCPGYQNCQADSGGSRSAGPDCI